MQASGADDDKKQPSHHPGPGLGLRLVASMVVTTLVVTAMRASLSHVLGNEDLMAANVEVFIGAVPLLFFGFWREFYQRVLFKWMA